MSRLLQPVLVYLLLFSLTFPQASQAARDEKCNKSWYRISFTLKTAFFGFTLSALLAYIYTLRRDKAAAEAKIKHLENALIVSSRDIKSLARLKEMETEFKALSLSAQLAYLDELHTASAKYLGTRTFIDLVSPLMKLLPPDKQRKKWMEWIEKKPAGRATYINSLNVSLQAAPPEEQEKVASALIALVDKEGVPDGAETLGRFFRARQDVKVSDDDLRKLEKFYDVVVQAKRQDLIQELSSGVLPRADNPNSPAVMKRIIDKRWDPSLSARDQSDSLHLISALAARPDFMPDEAMLSKMFALASDYRAEPLLTVMNRAPLDEKALESVISNLKAGVPPSFFDALEREKQGVPSPILADNILRILAPQLAKVDQVQEGTTDRLVNIAALAYYLNRAPLPPEVTRRRDRLKKTIAEKWVDSIESQDQKSGILFSLMVTGDFIPQLDEKQVDRVADHVVASNGASLRDVLGSASPTDKNLERIMKPVSTKLVERLSTRELPVREIEEKLVLLDRVIQRFPQALQKEKFEAIVDSFPKNLNESFQARYSIGNIRRSLDQKSK